METISEANDAAPTLTDVVDLLVTPTSGMCERAQVDTPRYLAREVMNLRYGIGKLLDGQLRGMFDGPSTLRPDWWRLAAKRGATGASDE